MLVDCHSVFKQNTKESCPRPQPSDNSLEQTKGSLWGGSGFLTQGGELDCSGKNIACPVGTFVGLVPDEWRKNGPYPRGPLTAEEKGHGHVLWGTAFLILVCILLGIPRVTNRVKAGEWLYCMYVRIKKLGKWCWLLVFEHFLCTWHDPMFVTVKLH